MADFLTSAFSSAGIIAVPSWEPGMVLWVLSVDTHYSISGFVYCINMTFSREYECADIVMTRLGETPRTAIVTDGIIAKFKQILTGALCLWCSLYFIFIFYDLFL